MALEFSLPQARHHLDELVARAHQDHERIVLTEHGKPAAVLISVAELDELQYAQDLADIARGVHGGTRRRVMHVGRVIER